MLETSRKYIGVSNIYAVGTVYVHFESKSAVCTCMTNVCDSMIGVLCTCACVHMEGEAPI